MAVVGINIKRLREAQEISREELGRRSGIAMHTLYKLENEIQGNPRLDTLQKISQALGVAIADLLEEPKAKAS